MTAQPPLLPADLATNVATQGEPSETAKPLPDLVLTLRPLRGSEAVDLRLKRALKTLFRRDGFRCVQIADNPLSPGPDSKPAIPSARLRTAGERRAGGASQKKP